MKRDSRDDGKTERVAYIGHAEICNDCHYWSAPTCDIQSTHPVSAGCHTLGQVIMRSHNQPTNKNCCVFRFPVPFRSQRRGAYFGGDKSTIYCDVWKKNGFTFECALQCCGPSKQSLFSPLIRSRPWRYINLLTYLLYLLLCGDHARACSREMH